VPSTKIKEKFASPYHIGPWKAENVAARILNVNIR